MPPSGWYDDPDQPWTWRYFDGAHWTDHRAPMWVPPARDPRSLSVWFDSAVAVVKRAVRQAGALLVVVWGVLGALGWWLLISAFDDDRGRELRRLLDIDQRTFGPLGSTTTTELTTAEADRVWELLQDIFWSTLPWLVALGLAFVVTSAWSIGAAVRAGRPSPDDMPSSPRQREGVGAIAAVAVRRTPAVLASGVVVAGLFAAVWLLATMPVVLVAVAGGGGAAVALTVVFVVLLVAVATFVLWGRLALAPVIAAVGGHGLGVRRSWELTHGRFWFVVGRLMITALIAGGVTSVVNLVNAFGQFLGFAAYVAIVTLVQAVATAAAIVATVAGHLATIDQVDDLDGVDGVDGVDAPP